MVIFDPFTDTGGGLEMLFRWGHVLSGITWIGLLYFFNFVQTPAYAELSPAARGEAFDKLTWRALWWFRWAAALTFLTGVFILGIQKNFGPNFAEYFAAPQGTSIAWGATLGTIMFLNVWGVIWRAQKVVLANAANVLAGGEPDPAAAAAGRKATMASRQNTVFSVTMLFFMIFKSHHPASNVVLEGSDLAIYWIIALAIIGIMELNCLGLLPWKTTPNKGLNAMYDGPGVRNPIIAMFGMWVVFLVLTEVLFVA